MEVALVRLADVLVGLFFVLYRLEVVLIGLAVALLGFVGSRNRQTSRRWCLES